MKLCAGCKKEIADEANFCPTCGIFQDKDIKPKNKWYFKKTSLMVSLLCVGPFMLPLVWFHPELSRTAKVLYTIVIVVLTYFIFVVFLKSMNSILSAYKLSTYM